MSRYPGRVAVAGLLLLPLPAASLLQPWLEDASYRLGAYLAPLPSHHDSGVAHAGLSDPELSETAPAGSDEGEFSFIDAPIGGSWALPDRPSGPVDTRASGRRFVALPDLRIDADRVLALVDTGVRPKGEPARASRFRPAGVRVAGVSGMGIGVQDGDVLVAVGGVPVYSAGEVVALVLSARARGTPAVVGRLYRGRRAYDLVVEMPYLEPDRSAVSSCRASPCSESEP